MRSALQSAMAIVSPSSKSTTASTSELPVFLQQPKADILRKFIDLEWQQRHRLLEGQQETEPPSQWARLTGDNVTARNRYLNVEPFAQNRIRLQVGEGVNDYINASPIALGRRRYIATQGPKDTSVNHFYRMIAAEVASPVVIVMLTQTHESGMEKCFTYYPLTAQESPLVIPPDPEAQDGFEGEIFLEKDENHAPTRCQIRTLRLRTQSNDSPPVEKEIKHFLFAGWPDFLIPEGEDRTALIELLHHTAKLNSTSPSYSLFDKSLEGVSRQTDHQANSTTTDTNKPDNPRIIHCSAGVGRSGTFIALDALLAALHAGELDAVPPDHDPIAETVDLLRQQRMMMVQRVVQFVFLYDVLREQFTARLRARGAGGEKASG